MGRAGHAEPRVRGFLLVRDDRDLLLRHARTEAIARVKKTENVSEDEKKHAEKELQKLHDDHIRMVDDAVKAKEAEIMEV